MEAAVAGQAGGAAAEPAEHAVPDPRTAALPVAAPDGCRASGAAAENEAAAEPAAERARAGAGSAAAPEAVGPGSAHPTGTPADRMATAGQPAWEQPRAGADAEAAPGAPVGGSAGLNGSPENQAAADEQWQELGSEPGSEPGSGLGSEAGSDVDPVAPPRAGASAPDADTAAHALHSLALGGREVPGGAAAGERWRANGTLAAQSIASAAPAHADAEAGVPRPCTGSPAGEMRSAASKRADADAPAPQLAAAAGDAGAARSAETGGSCPGVLANGMRSGAGQAGSGAEREGDPKVTSRAPGDSPKAARPASAAAALQRGGPCTGFGPGQGAGFGPGQGAAPAAVRLSLEEAFFLAHALRALRVLAPDPRGAGGLAELTTEVAPALLQCMSVLCCPVRMANALPGAHCHDRTCCQRPLCA